ncbi:MAG: ABC transporter ATP-binding protein [Phycisphaerae bacterium]
MNEALVLTEVTKRYGSYTAVDGLTVSVPTGQVFGFLGPNGAGKTSTLRMVMSILYPDSGTIRVLGRPRAVDVKDRVGFLPEERGLYRKMTVEATLRYFGRLKGLRGPSLAQRVGGGLERIGLSAWRHKRIEALSKGMQQKVQFLCAILHEPELVILDEPFSGLDPLNVELIKSLIVELRERGATVVLSTHQMELAQRLCDHIVLINRGRKILDSSIHEARTRFATRTVILEGDGDFEALGGAPGVSAAHVTAGHGEYELADGVDPDTLLRRAVGAMRISRFEVVRPDLQQIFVKLVGADVESGGGPDASSSAGARRMSERAPGEPR